MAFGSSSYAGDATDLLKKLRAQDGKKSDLNSLLLVDLGDLGLPEDDEHLMDEIAEFHSRIARLRNGDAYRLSPVNIALLVSLNDMNRMEVQQDLKMKVIETAQEEVPERAGEIDQAKIVRAIDLTTQAKGAIKFLEAFEDRAKEKGVITSPDGTRALTLADPQTIRSFHTQTGEKAFSDEYIQGQSITLIVGDGPPTPFAKEYFVRLDLLGADALAGVEIHESDALFPQLAMALDGLVLPSIRHFIPSGAKCALNLNLETVSSNAFKTFLGTMGQAKLSNVIFEFRMANIMRDLRKYEAAAKLIRAQGGNVAIDVIDPHALTVLNLSGFKADIAKIVWRESGAGLLAHNRPVIKRAQEQGCIVVLCRVDSNLGVQVGREVGITAFQGFHVDDMLL